MSQVTVHHPSSYGFSGSVGLPATVTGGSSATFSYQSLTPGAHTITWGGGSPTTDAMTVAADGTGTATHTYPAGSGTYVQFVTENATGRRVAQRTITLPYSGGAGFLPRSMPPLPGGDEGEGDDEEFDPFDHTIAEVEAYVDEHPDETQGILDAEIAGKNRVTLVNWLQAQLPYDPGSYTVGEVQDYVSTNPDQRDAVLAAEQAGKNRSTLVSWLENFTTGE